MVVIGAQTRELLRLQTYLYLHFPQVSCAAAAKISQYVHKHFVARQKQRIGKKILKKSTGP